MKKLILGFAAIVTVIGANAQKKGNIRYGVKAGINVSTLQLKASGTSQTAGSKVGFAGGGFVEIPVASNFAVQPEVLYSQMGTKATSTRINMDYISVPVLAKYNSGGLAVYAGPQVGVLVSAKQKTSGTTTDIKDDLKSIDFAGVFGTEYAFSVGIVLSARYQLGMVDIADNGGMFSSTKLKNQGFNFTVGYRFGGKK